MLDSLSANLEIRFASFCNPGGVPIRARSDNAIRLPSMGSNDLAQGFVDTCQEEQGKAGERSENTYRLIVSGGVDSELSLIATEKPRRLRHRK